ncbi:10666_t:CDS:2 [Paraglomus occultum]|uniref:Biogenesis of lysosome-related organelles complex 1 subunit 7 n=1 Tax=Paraglomus occultum TaxID=144539 RepID=A0A9N9BU34_9GLOM|nr:10666_t:CDS:2 [Paraglomus occultum]
MAEPAGKRTDSNLTESGDSTDEKLVEGIMALLSPIVQEMDTSIVSVKSSQEALSKEIERLLAELQLFAEASEPSPIQPSVQKLMNARKRLTATNQTLKTVSDRIKKIYTQLNKENPTV